MTSMRKERTLRPAPVLAVDDVDDLANLGVVEFELVAHPLQIVGIELTALCDLLDVEAQLGTLAHLLFGHRQLDLAALHQGLQLLVELSSNLGDRVSLRDFR